MIRCHIRGTHVNLCSHCPQDIDLFFGLLVTHRANQAIPLHSTSQCEPHAGIATGAFNDRASWQQQTLLFGIFNHAQRHPIFNAVTRVEIFNFGQHLTWKFRSDAIQSDHRRIANGR